MNNPYSRAGHLASTYVDVRPRYPDALVDVLLDGVPSDAILADVGAGTGKLTAQLVERGYAPYAIEPSADMRSAFRSAHPTFPSERLLPTTAEHTGLPDSGIDVVVYAQSWHWVDVADGPAELARIVRPGGRVGVIVNQLDVTVPWIKRLTRIMRSGDVHRAARPPSFETNFNEPILYRHSWVDRLTRAELIELGKTRASWLRSTAENRARMTGNLKWFLDRYGVGERDLIELPYVSMLWLASRVPQGETDRGGVGATH